AAEGLPGQPGDSSAEGGLAVDQWVVAVLAAVLGATDQVPGVEVLQQPQGGGVAHVPVAIDPLVHLGDGGGLALPEDVQDGQFGWSDLGRVRYDVHRSQSTMGIVGGQGLLRAIATVPPAAIPPRSRDSANSGPLTEGCSS